MTFCQPYLVFCTYEIIQNIDIDDRIFIKSELSVPYKRTVLGCSIPSIPLQTLVGSSRHGMMQDSSWCSKSVTGTVCCNEIKRAGSLHLVLETIFCNEIDMGNSQI